MKRTACLSRNETGCRSELCLSYADGFFGFTHICCVKQLLKQRRLVVQDPIKWIRELGWDLTNPCISTYRKLTQASYRLAFYFINSKLRSWPDTSAAFTTGSAIITASQQDSLGREVAWVFADLQLLPSHNPSQQWQGGWPSRSIPSQPVPSTDSNHPPMKMPYSHACIASS